MSDSLLLFNIFINKISQTLLLGMKRLKADQLPCLLVEESAPRLNAVDSEQWLWA